LSARSLIFALEQNVSRETLPLSVCKEFAQLICKGFIMALSVKEWIFNSFIILTRPFSPA
jgi:hypothetical protein